MYDMPVDPKPDEMKKPSARVTMHKDHASKMAVGSDLNMRVKGKVKGVNKSFDHPDHYDVEMEDVETTPDDEAKEDKKYNMATMPKKHLKKMISKSSDEE